jgi:hypothetical protein
VPPVFFLVRCNGWSHCVWPNETNKKQYTSNHVNQYKIIDFTWKSWTLHVETGLAPHISKSHLRACGSGCLAWPTSARGCLFYLKLSKDKIIVDLAISKIYGGSGWVGRPYMFMTLGSWICGVQTAGNRDDTQPRRKIFIGKRCTWGIASPQIYYLAFWRGGRKGNFKGSVMGWQMCG